MDSNIRDSKLRFYDFDFSSQHQTPHISQESNIESQQLDYDFTQEEDKLLLRLVQNKGEKFRILRKYFPGKNQKELKNRYKVIQKQNKVVKLLDNTPIFPEAQNLMLTCVESLFQGLEQLKNDVMKAD